MVYKHRLCNRKNLKAMIKKTKRTRKYFAPQNEEGVKHLCDHPGCDKCGEYRAPKDRSLKEYYWFCLEHVQEYNAKWNYYDGETDDDSPKEEAERRRRFSFKNFGSRVKYNFGYDFVEFPDGLFGEKSFAGYDEEDIYLSEEERAEQAANMALNGNVIELESDDDWQSMATTEKSEDGQSSEEFV